eukprot:COSAG02_NODE_40824_length_401_cov_0.804636_1_plen_110_part_10
MSAPESSAGANKLAVPKCADLIEAKTEALLGGGIATATTTRERTKGCMSLPSKADWDQPPQRTISVHERRNTEPCSGNTRLRANHGLPGQPQFALLFGPSRPRRPASPQA